MFEKIIVPLDGSKLAECVLPYVKELAKGCSTQQITLVSVTEHIVAQTFAPEIGEIGQIPIEPIPVAVGRKKKQAERYLHRIAKRLSAKDLNVQIEVLLGNPAEEITAFAKESGADLIAIASHGRSGISRWAFGSVTDKVFRASSVPVLMIKAPVK